MADLSITPSAVLPSSSAVIFFGMVAGEDLSAGDAVRTLGTPKKWWKAGSTGASPPAPGDDVGIVLVSAAAGQPVMVAMDDPDLVLGSVLTQGETYYLSSNLGKIAPYGDLGVGWFRVALGVAKNATTLMLKVGITGTHA